MKQVVGKRINKKRYLYSLTVSLPGGATVELMVFTLFGLLMRRTSHDGCRDRCRGILILLYKFVILFNFFIVLNVYVTSGAGPRAVGTERGRWSEW